MSAAGKRHGRLLVVGRLTPATVHFDTGPDASGGGRITAISLDRPNQPGIEELPIIAPGLVDLHVHGYGGHGAMDLRGMSTALAGAGTTSFLPTLFPAAPAELGEQAEGVWKAAQGINATISVTGAGDGGDADDSHPLGARPLGLHLEGPFVNPEAAGALPRDGLAQPSLESLREILGPATGDGRGIRTMTLAPELPGALELVAELARCGVRASLGHSRTTAAEARAAADAGAMGVTHLYNAMSGLHHREVGLVGFALSSSALCAELIGDLVHVGADAIDLTLNVRGVDGIALVSDALAGAGTGCDVFESHGHTCHVKDGAIWIDDPSAPGGSRLTGAAASQLEAVRRLVEAGVLSAEEALRSASETPARALGLENDLGRLAVGARADLIVLAPNLDLQEVLVGGVSFRGGVPGIEETGR